MKITVSTVVAAPLQDVWAAYTTPEDIKAWNTASADWHTTASTVDLQPGGKFSSRMEAKDGSFGFDFAGEYTNIVHLQLIEYVFGDRTGRVEFKEGPEEWPSPSPSMPKRPTPRNSSAAAGRRSWTASVAT